MASMLSLALLQKKVPDGDVRNARGAKRGGYTDHLAGPHLIPNVGREAMVPAECVKRQPRPVRKEPPKVLPPVAPKVVKQLKAKPQERRRRSPSVRRRSRSRSRSRRRSRSSSSEDESEEARKSVEEERKRAKSPDAETKRRNEEERQRQRQREIEAYREAERHRQDQERVKLEAFKEAQMRRKELDSVRKKRLSGAFALDEDDIPEEHGEAAPPKARSARPRSASLVPVDATPGPLPYAGNASSSALRIADGENVTAADLDGSQHDHKFSAVWKDWTAQKRDDPGEIAKQFMKIAAIKRRGFEPRGRR